MRLLRRREDDDELADALDSELVLWARWIRAALGPDMRAIVRFETQGMPTAPTDVTPKDSLDRMRPTDATPAQQRLEQLRPTGGEGAS
jgi:hypothetical protein